MSTTILSLPLELIHHIALQADQPAQASLSATSKSLHHAADRALYRHISLSSSHPSTLSAVLTLSKRANDLGPHVRSFSLAVTSSTPVLRAYASAVARALEGMHALKDLNLSLDSSSSWLLDLVEPRTAYPSLKSFTSSFALDGPVSRFLSRTPALTSLSLAPSPSATLLPPTSIPVLTHFSGSLSSAPRDRPLSTLYALDGDLSSSALSVLPPLSVLSASTSTDLVPFLHALAAHHPTLAYLRLAAPLPLARDATFPDIRFYEDVACALDKLPALVDFELAGMHWPSHVEPTPTPSPTTPTTKRVWHSAPSSPRPSSPSLPSPMEEEFFPDSAFPESLSLAPLEVSEGESGEGEGDLYEDLDVLF